MDEYKKAINEAALAKMTDNQGNGVDPKTALDAAIEAGNKLGVDESITTLRVGDRYFELVLNGMINN